MPSGEPSMIRLDRGSADFEACFSALVNDRREAGRDVSADVAAIWLMCARMAMQRSRQ